MQTTGYIKLYRELFTKPIWQESTPEQKTILTSLLAMANYKGCEWEYQGQRYEIKSGQFVTSIPSIISVCGKGITEQNVRTALKRFEKLGFLTDEPMKRNKNRLITIVKWGFYQGKTDYNLTDSLTDGVTDNLTDTETPESLDTKGIEANKDNNLTDSLTDRVTDKLNPKEKVKEIKNKKSMSGKPDCAYPFVEIVEYLNTRYGKNFRPTTEATQKLIRDRMNENFTVDDFKRVIDNMATEWIGKTFNDGTPAENYLQPSTLFSKRNFEGYLNRVSKVQSQEPYLQPEQITIAEDTGPNLD